MSLWNFTIADTSPILSYFPYADEFGLQNGWQTWYTTSGFNTQAGASPAGDSFHLTSVAGAKVSLEFYGNAIYLYGTANTSYDVILDGSIQSFSGANGLMYSNEGLIEENHNVTLISKASGVSEQLGFARAVVSASDQKVITEAFYDNSDSALSYPGSWENKTINGIPNVTVTAPFHLSSGLGSSVTMNFTSAVAIALYGSTTVGHVLYSVSIDNEAPRIYNASSVWLIANAAIFFQSGLDPGRKHTLKATNMSGGGANFSLSSIVLYQATATPSSSSSPAGSSNSPTTQPDSTSGQSHFKVGEIVGPVVGALALVLIAAFLWFRARKSRPDHTKTISPLILFDQSRPDGPDQATNTPSEMTETGPLQPSSSTRKNHVPLRTAPNSPPSPPPAMPQHGAPISPTPPGTADVNQIIELIAQRIDRRGEGHSESHLPPEYRVHSM
ncbi:hypothetical protein DFH09DRAFT_55045 [Mycena vulgaris]|nr:hypothetical protein DFH09DRAFT_55045 [Mycena vulgaris]